MRSLIFLGSLFLMTSGLSAQERIPKPSRDQLSALADQMGSMRGRVEDLLSLTDLGALENDAVARRFLLEFSTKLERLEDALNAANEHYDQDDLYGKDAKNACLQTRQLFLLNSQAERAAGEHAVGQLLPSNPAFGDSRVDVKDVRDTIFCQTIEAMINNHDGRYSNSKWNSSYHVSNQKVRADLQLHHSNGRYHTDSFAGELFDVIYFDEHISGRWKANNDHGWFEFSLRHDAFSGFWGRGELGSPLGGEWSGRKH